MTRAYYRPLAQTGPIRPPNAVTLADGLCWFETVEVITRDGPSRFVGVDEVPAEALHRLTSSRPALMRGAPNRPVVMGILNVTPDSFSDGGTHNAPAQALAHARRIVAAGAQIIDVGGESTRPGAVEVPYEAEVARTAPVITAISRELSVPISIDTRKRSVAEAAAAAGAALINDVSGFTFDKRLAPFCAENNLPVIIMHAQGDPETMQDDPRYDDVLLDVYDFLEAQVVMLEDLGIPRGRIVVDPGIGFGKKIPHNLRLLNNISLFHGLGCLILLGVSRKGFIREIGNAPTPEDRAPGSIAVGLAALAQGVQVLRVHDVEETVQAVALWRAAITGEHP